MARSRLGSLGIGLLAAAIAGSSIAYAAGLFPGFPIVGGASYCNGVSGTGSGTGSSTFSTTPGAQFGQGQVGQSGTFANPCISTVSAGPPVQTGMELVPADTQLASGQQPQTVLLPSVLLGSTNVRTNRLVGGDFATNLWQRGTTPVSAASPSTTVIGADRWAVYSSANVVTVTKQTAAADSIPAQGFNASMRVSRPSGTNTSAICVGQVLDKQATNNLIANNGVLSFYALAGAGLSAVAGNNLTVTIAYYTAADSATPLTNTDAFMKGTVTGYQAVTAGGSVGTTAAVTAGVATVNISTTWTRYGVYGAIPATNAAGTAVTGAGVTICYTPASGTGGATEWFEIEGVQLQPTPSRATPAMPAGVTAYTGFERRHAQLEADLQQYYSYVLQETNGAVYPGGVLCTATGNAWIALSPGISMRETPTLVVTAGGFSIRTAAAVTGIGTTTLLAGSTASTFSLTSGAACTSTLPYQLVGTNTTGSLVFSAEP